MIEKEIGLGFSGGGYRAAAYHIGTLEALNNIVIDVKGEKKEKRTLLSRINNFVSASGGSITAAYYLKSLRNEKKFTDFSGKLKTTLQEKNCEWYTIVLNPILLLFPLFIGVFGLGLMLLKDVLPFYVIRMEHLQVVFFLILAFYIFIAVANIIIKKSRNIDIFRYTVVSVICVLTAPFLVVSLLTFFKDDGIVLSWLMTGFGLTAAIIAILIVLIGKMIHKVAQGVLGCVLAGIIIILCFLFVPAIIECDGNFINAIIKTLKDPDVSQNIFGLVSGFFSYIIFYLVHLILPIGYSARKRKFFEKYFFGKKQMNDLADGKRIGILATRMENGRSCIFQKMKNSDDTAVPGNPYSLADAVSKSCNWPPVYEPEQLIVEGSFSSCMSRDGHIILLNPGEVDVAGSAGKGKKIESYCIKPSDKKTMITGDDGYAITLSDGGILDNHGVSLLANRELSLFSKVILLSDSDPPFECTDADQGFFGHLFELVAKVLVDNVHQLNIEKYFNAYFPKFGNFNVKPLFISLRNDIESLIDKYIVRAAYYKSIQEEGAEIEDFIAQSRFGEYHLAQYYIDNYDPANDAHYNRRKAVYAKLLSDIGFAGKCNGCEYFQQKRDEKILKDLRKIQTRLIPIEPELQENLIKHARNMTEFLVKFWLLEKADNKTDTFRFRHDIFVGQINRNEFKKLKSVKSSAYHKFYRPAKGVNKEFYELDYTEIRKHVLKSGKKNKSMIKKMEDMTGKIYKVLHTR